VFYAERRRLKAGKEKSEFAESKRERNPSASALDLSEVEASAFKSGFKKGFIIESSDLMIIKIKS